MFIVSRGPYALIGIAASIAITLFMYFAVIRPATHTANNAYNHAVRSEQQALKQSSREFGRAGMTQAQKLTDCLSQAGVDASAVQACQAKFGTP